jgi:hypothetical protein
VPATPDRRGDNPTCLGELKVVCISQGVVGERKWSGIRQGGGVMTNGFPLSITLKNFFCLIHFIKPVLSGFFCYFWLILVKMWTWTFSTHVAILVTKDKTFTIHIFVTSHRKVDLSPSLVPVTETQYQLYHLVYDVFQLAKQVPTSVTYHTHRI